MSKSSRIFGLDLIRAIAIILVVLSHGAFLLKDSALEGFPFFRMIDGVDLFFVLSGFLIGSILLKEIEDKQSFSIKQLGHFWKRRWFRTLPNYYLILLLNYLVVSQGIIKEDIHQFSFHFLTFTHNFAWSFKGFFWESWSLSVEEWFYIFSPLLVMLFIRFFKAKTAFLLTTLLMIIIPTAYRWINFTPDLDSFMWDIGLRKVVLTRLDSIGYGLLAAWLHYYFPQKWIKAKWSAFALGALLMFFIIYYRYPATTVYKQVFYFTLTPIAVMFVLPLFQTIKTAQDWLRKPIEYISKISYSMYLVNLALVAEVIRDNFAPQGGTDAIVKYSIYWVVVIVASSFIYRFYEKPIMNLRER